MPTGVFKRSKEHIENWKASMKWYRPSEATKRKISERMKVLCRTPEFREKMRESNLGEKVSNWQGGKTEKNKLIRQSYQYRLWREEVFKRDNWRCVICKTKGGWNGKLKIKIILQADHIKPFALYPELRFELSNGRTLCINCHRKTDTFGKFKRGGKELTGRD